MAERLTVSLEDGTTENLRTMAGGERKVGVYLSNVVAWLWSYRDTLSGAPLTDFAPVLHEWIPRIVMTPEEQQEALEANKSIRAQLDAIDEYSQRLEEKLNLLEAKIDATSHAGATMDAVEERPQ